MTTKQTNDTPHFITTTELENIFGDYRILTVRKEYQENNAILPEFTRWLVYAIYEGNATEEWTECLRSFAKAKAKHEEYVYYFSPCESMS
jgi:hypothetical protein